ncbi:NAD(P)-dependent oxidoreductase [Mucilaginibacter limnophilus]|uniref:NAD(P)-dependent oxidoreductase n=1 Tax=Mucilaginibacter limnophilus TaxID=1932778 RepID=A0A437MK94_9SPHI|nr:NAD(P)-dependent oxidoreductase [Mucilaginibacter limnophilus]RVT98094.1 NAD(P)-dependent oxidoreductase [Mucilaginibacter limnophilus]
MEKRIGFIGLGNLGIPMAKNLITDGYHLQVYNRTTSKAKELEQGSITVCSTPAEAARNVDFVITILSEDEVVKDAVLGDNGFLKTMRPGALHISMSTILPDTSEELLAIHNDAGSRYLAAPVFGRPEAAAARKLWICTSGAADVKEAAKPVLESLGQGIIDFGETTGGANVVKLTGNFMIMAALETMAEGYTIAEKSGLDRKQVADFFSSTLFACPIFQNYGKFISAKQYEPVAFKAKLGYKDARLALKVAQQTETPAPLVSLVHNRLLTSVAKGNGDNSDWIAAFGKGVSDEAGV